MAFKSSRHKPTHDEIRAIILERVESSTRLKYTIDDIAAELSISARHGASIPQATVSQWTRDIERMVADGLIEMTEEGFLRTPKPKHIPKNTQLDLFS